MKKTSLLVVLSLLVCLNSCNSTYSKFEVRDVDNDSDDTGILAQSDTLSSTVAFDEYLNIFDRRRVESIAEAAVFYENSVENWSSKEKDEAFLIFRKFYYQVIDEVNADITMFIPVNAGTSMGTEEALHRPEILAFQKKLKENGLQLSISGGVFSVEEKPEYLYSIAAPYVSSAVKEFLSIRNNSLTKEFTETDELATVMEQIGKNMVSWEKYIEKHPGSLLLGEAKDLYSKHLNIFLLGITHTPAFINKREQVLAPEVKQAYFAFIEKNAQTKSGVVIKKYYSILSDCGFKRCAKVEEFLRNASQQEHMVVTNTSAK